MNQTINVDVLGLYTDLQGRDLTKHTVVVIDVLRATSVIVTALAHGAASILPVDSEQAAYEAKKIAPNALLGGEKGGVKIPGFDLDNSPLAYTREVVQDRDIILSTSNGTKALGWAQGAKTLLCASTLNAAAIAQKCVHLADDVLIVCAGTDLQFSCDDAYCAGCILQRIQALCPCALTDRALITSAYYTAAKNDPILLQNTYHYNLLRSLGFINDLSFCFQEDRYTTLPIYTHPRIIAKASTITYTHQSGPV